MSDLVEKPNQIFEEFLNLLSIKETSSIRLVFYEKDFFLQKIYYANGEFSEDFSLLDDQIFDQIAGKNNLIIQDTSRIHTIRFFQGNIYPRSIMAFPIKHQNKNIGIVWVGDLNYQAFSKQDFELFEKTIKLYQNILALTVKKHIIDQELLILRMINQDEKHPVLVFNNEQKISYANKSAISAFNLTQNENDHEISCDLDFLSLLFDPDKSETFIFSINKKHYEVFRIQGFQNLSFQIAGFKFIDKGQDIAKNEYLETIVSTMLQRLRSPMVEIRGLASLISAHGTLSEKQNEFLSQINSRISELEDSTGQLLDVNKIKQASFINLEEFTIQESLANVVELLSPLAEQKQISLNVKLPDHRISIVSDRVLFQHALLNIIDHAIKETRIGGMVEIDHKVESQNQIISISDSGKGISQLDVNKMMEENRIDPNMGEMEISRRIMRVLKGDLKIESNLGSGTKITLQFPDFGNN